MKLRHRLSGARLTIPKAQPWKCASVQASFAFWTPKRLKALEQRFNQRCRAPRFSTLAAFHRFIFSRRRRNRQSKGRSKIGILRCRREVVDSIKRHDVYSASRGGETA